jgi:hypothetical protein
MAALPSSMPTEELFAGVCDMCRLRYGVAAQLNPATMAANHAEATTAAETAEGSDEPVAPVCCICEGILPSLLNASTISTIAASIPPYDSATITLGVVLPSSVTLNDLSFQLYLATQ